MPSLNNVVPFTKSSVVQRVVDPTQGWADDVAVFQQLRENETESLWAQADWALAMTAKYGRSTAQKLAGELRVSASYIRSLVAAARAFPEPADRAGELSFTHYRVAAMTQQPDDWIDQACDKKYSVKDLREAIGDAKDGVSEAEQARRAKEALIQSARVYNERYADLSGEQVSLTWEPVSGREVLSA